MRRRVSLWAMALVALVALCSLADGGDRVWVRKVTDGDTFILSTGERVRLLGVDAPEDYADSEASEYYARESKEYLQALVPPDRKIVLQFDPDQRKDVYSRQLCYVWAGTSDTDSVLVNLELIKNGYAMAYLRFPHPREEEFLAAELAARRQAIGMWSSQRDARLLKKYEEDADDDTTLQSSDE